MLETLSDAFGAEMPAVLRLGIPDEFPHEYGSQDTMFDTYGLKGPQIAKSVSIELSANDRSGRRVRLSMQPAAAK